MNSSILSFHICLLLVVLVASTIAIPISKPEFIKATKSKTTHPKPDIGAVAREGRNFGYPGYGGSNSFSSASAQAGSQGFGGGFPGGFGGGFSGAQANAGSHSFGFGK